jgi:hypothetical protein
VAFAALCIARPTSATDAAPVPGQGDGTPRYDTGSPILRELWVDPLAGDDAASGTSPETALRTVSAAWATIPTGVYLQTGVRINLRPGDYAADSFPIYWEHRHGTIDAPIEIRATDGPGSVTLAGNVNVFDVRYLYLIDLTIAPDPPGDAFHCERCDHLLLRGVELNGGDRQAWETLKINQSTHVYVEESDVHGAADNAIDFVAVQHGHVVRTRIHDAQDWCVYAKGGSAHLRYEGNEIFDCGVGGFTAGQGTGFQYMVAPYLTYEAEEIVFIGNHVHDTEGAGMGVNGGREILLQANTLERVGNRSHLIEVGFGGRTCDGPAEEPSRELCAEYLAAGGWGTTAIDDGTNAVRIPNKDVQILDNTIRNPAGQASRWQHFAIPAPYDGPEQVGSNVPAPTLADDGLVIRGNVIANGPPDHPLGIGGPDAGCQPANPTCNETRLRAENQINETASLSSAG